ncbi:LysR family transcriptional regulator [Pseudomonas syringae pv. dysoxyli]|uniref:LysR family transcriptional regulator n=1 Tax=Pseudomonas syringae TaxID=317 RepID=UPI001372CE3E|nr:LysR family transcriptional regulator [Pseudomonas syringae]NAO28843.1 LysR family transcriptional regulator [Pseudomonas syringae pv. dysoxyli]
MKINEQLFAGLDINSLLTFLVVYQERCVSRAALRLKVNQSAVSNTLAKLRHRFDDFLFVRSGRGVHPTQRAFEIAQSLLPAFLLIQEVLPTAEVLRS